MTDLEKYELAKEAYYNGTPIMEDYEFDELEERLGLSNKSYVGAKHNPSYTVKHPFIMGSLSKVQIKKSDDGTIDWVKYVGEAQKFYFKNGKVPCVMTPKYDGCSFEAQCNKGTIINISSRGDGDWGADYTNHLTRFVQPDVDAFAKYFEGNVSMYTLRGEVLIDKNIFAEKYSNFVNPRSFVSGILNRDYSEDNEFQEMLNDLSIVIYDVRALENNVWVDHDWFEFDYPDKPMFSYNNCMAVDCHGFEAFYNNFESYRHDNRFALDGFVIKPLAKYRENNLSDARPKDCVAIKFVPMLEETEVIDIEWSTRKTNELRPVIIVNPVNMDGKQIARASAHNYGFLIDNKISVGTKVILSLAGDIIPFIYKVTNTDNFDESKLCIDTDIETYQDGCHLYKKMSVKEANKQKFIASASALNIPSIGPAAAETIYDYMIDECKGDEFFGIPQKETPNNILLVLPEDVNRALGGKLGVNAKKAMIAMLKEISIKDIIVSCTFEGCGNRVAEEIEKQMLFGNGDFEHLANKAYQWVLNGSADPNFQQVNKIMNFIGKSVDDYKIEVENTVAVNSDAIPVILTGEPNTYNTKADFLKAHPEYKMTTSWKEVKIVFTNSLDSNTGKMKKAREKNIEIKLY